MHMLHGGSSISGQKLSIAFGLALTQMVSVRACVRVSQGLKRMGPSVSTFVLVVDARGLCSKHMDLVRDKQLLHMATTAYPDRLGALVVGPVNSFIRSS